LVAGLVWCMVFSVPSAQSYVAIPLETFIHSLSTVLCIISCAALRALALVFRLLGLVLRGTLRFVSSAYDVLVFMPLWIERLLIDLRHQNADRKGAQTS